MLIIEPEQWNGTRAALVAAVAAFAAAKVAHAQTVNVPAPTAPPIVEWLHQTGAAFKLRAEVIAEAPQPTPAEIAVANLAATDKQMARVTEDVIAALVAKGTIALTDLPAEARAKLTQRQNWRAQL